VDRGNLGKQTEDEFANLEAPDDRRKLPTPYTVQRLKTNAVDPAANRLGTMLLSRSLTGGKQTFSGPIATSQK
jgi:hypothetical protein